MKFNKEITYPKLYTLRLQLCGLHGGPRVTPQLCNMFVNQNIKTYEERESSKCIDFVRNLMKIFKLVLVRNSYHEPPLLRSDLGSEMSFWLGWCDAESTINFVRTI